MILASLVGIFALSPAQLSAAEPAQFSVGLSAAATGFHVLGAEGSTGFTTSGSFGLLTQWDPHRLFAIQLGFRAPYPVGFTAVEPADDSSRVYMYDAELIQGDMTGVYRPLGRRVFTPSLEVGASWRSHVGGFIGGHSPGDLAEKTRHVFQPHLGAKLGWGSSWRRDSFHLAIGGRAYVPAAVLPGAYDRHADDAQAIAWEARLGVRLYLF